jgi:hypothetical protein
MITVTKHFIQQINNRVINAKNMTANEVNVILKKIDRVNIPIGKTYIQVKKLDYIFNSKIDSTRGDILIFVVKKDSFDVPGSCITAIYTFEHTSGQYQNRIIL